MTSAVIDHPTPDAGTQDIRFYQIASGKHPAALVQRLDQALHSRLRALCHPVLFKGPDRRVGNWGAEDG